MIQSMTGYGAAQHSEESVCYSLEIRSVNNRYLKLSIKLPDYLLFAESEIDKLVRGRVARGTVTCTLRVRSEGVPGARAINGSVLKAYVDQLSRAGSSCGVVPTIDLATVALLPGVSEPPDLDDHARERELGILRAVVERALEALTAMRQEEGRALREDLDASISRIRAELTTIVDRAPFVVDEYHQRLKSRVEVLTQSANLDLESEGLMREVAIFAERCDIAEEVSRLTSHLDQFAELCDGDERVGRTLDFLAQELLREANTIASKSNDATIARSVVLIKGSIDRLKEQVQNVE